MEADDHDVWLREAGELISNARHHPETLEPALRQLSRRAFWDFLFSPSIILDYMVVSTPGLFGEAGYSDVEVNELLPTIDRIIGEEWAARRDEKQSRLMEFEDFHIVAVRDISNHVAELLQRACLRFQQRAINEVGTPEYVVSVHPEDVERAQRILDEDVGPGRTFTNA